MNSFKDSGCSAGDSLSAPAQPKPATRREFMQAGIAAAGAALTSSILPQARAEAPAKKPNLIFIYTEGQRSDALSIAGNRILKTPNQDRIGREGVVFKNAFCTNALCLPSRAVALTGMYSHSTGAMGNFSSPEPLPADIPIVTDLLHEAGYEVAMCGKAHVGNGARERYWDYYFGFNAPVTNYYAPQFYEGQNGEMGEEATYSGYADDLATDRALTWLRKERDKPFCLLLWQQAPHAPFFRRRPDLNLYNGIPIPVPATFDDDLRGYPGKSRAFADGKARIGTIDDHDAVRSLEELVKDYNAGLVAVDRNVGRIFNWLEQSSQLDDTAIIHSSDHGYFLGEWRTFDKRYMYEPSLRVPAMLRYPRLFRSGTVIDEMVLNLDIAPTMLELAGVRIPERMQGYSFVGLARGEKTTWREDWLYEYDDHGVLGVPRHRGVRTDRYKLISYYHQTPPEFELYDLQSDPGEIRNVYGDPRYKDIQTRLWERMAQLRRETGDLGYDYQSR